MKSDAKGSITGRLCTIAAVFWGSFLILIWGAGAPAIATPWVDPVGMVQSQDEATYAASTLRMVRQGDWMTPWFAGRFDFLKPPFLYWSSAVSGKIFGPSVLALRLPSILAGAATATLVFAWVRTSSPLAASLAAAILLISSRLFFGLSRLAMTDSLLTFETTAALFVIARDPRLASNAAVWMFGIACGAAIMTKGAAALLAMIAFTAFCLVGGVWPTGRRLVQAGAITLAIALPWHLFQLWAHPHWFWTEYVLRQHLFYGLGAPSQLSQESPVLYYLKRLCEPDPILPAAAALALWRVRPRLALIWIGVVFSAALLFHFRNATYLLPLLPPLAIVAGMGIPARFAGVGLALAILLFGVKSGVTGKPWSLPFAPEFVNASYAELDKYAASHRGNTLILGNTNDQFYSALLPLPRVRYLYLGVGPNQSDPLDFRFLGIAVTVAEFEDLDALMPTYRARLRAMDLDSADPIATVILGRNEDEIRALIAANPLADFYVPQPWAAFGAQTHDAMPPVNGRVFLLSRVKLNDPSKLPSQPDPAPAR